MSSSLRFSASTEGLDCPVPAADAATRGLAENTCCVVTAPTLPIHGDQMVREKHVVPEPIVYNLCVEALGICEVLAFLYQLGVVLSELASIKLKPDLVPSMGYLCFTKT
ncbi:hypothetical protein SELMODRAFT_408465 [Selaginella moellendorffii]|uniref:Uncharacterized protein n=1 Tax=Selaginella moellendorffii TaxID=88036 RepID=D8R8E2_SELML|nr:hypothetical protein SELMODRAFT_408465 [Selaginella moellendorffii]